MKKSFLLLIITLFSVYGYSQTLDKTNKRYEAFLAEQKQNPDLKLRLFILSSNLQSYHNLNYLQKVFSEKEEIISVQTFENKNQIFIYYVNTIDESTITELLKKARLVDYVKIQDELYTIKN